MDAHRRFPFDGDIDVSNTHRLFISPYPEQLHLRNRKIPCQAWKKENNKNLLAPISAGKTGLDRLLTRDIRSDSEGSQSHHLFGVVFCNFANGEQLLDGETSAF